MAQTKFTTLITVLLTASALATANVDDQVSGSREVPKEERISKRADNDTTAKKSKKEINALFLNEGQECLTPKNANAKLSKENQKLAKYQSTNLSITNHPGAFHNPIMISFSFFGDIIQIEDGSEWIINPKQAYICNGWLTTDLVVITPAVSIFSPYEYCITNQMTMQTVEVNLYTGSPIHVRSSTRWIQFIDYWHRLVVLNDGSSWSMSLFDGSVVDKWIVGDIVIIGVNDGWNKHSNPNILINAQTCEYARGFVY